MIKKAVLGDFLRCATLNKPDIVGSLAVGSTTIALAVVPLFIKHHHLAYAQEMFVHRLGHAVMSGLSVLDSFSFTSNVVTFLFWGVVGIIIYGFTTALLRFWESNELYREISSGEYVHPSGFSKPKYWRLVLEKESFAAAILIVELTVVCLMLFWIFPRLLGQVNGLFTGITAPHVVYAVLWAAVLLGLFCLARFVFKAWRYRHILFVI